MLVSNLYKVFNCLKLICTLNENPSAYYICNFLVPQFLPIELLSPYVANLTQQAGYGQRSCSSNISCLNAVILDVFH